MLSFLVCAQLAAGALTHDSTYSSTALRAAVAAAAAANHEPPAALRAYRSHIETEISLLIRDTLGREHSAEVEQFATAASWERGGRYDLHVLGYRSQSVGVPYSTLSIVRAWTVPSLYGERLSLGTYFRNDRAASDTLVAVHPFAADRDTYYRFTGGDTVAVLRSGHRTIPMIRVRVHPHITGSTRFAAFDGEIDLDADRSQIIRMRGQIVVQSGRPRARDALLRQMVVAAAYVEFVNAEVGEKYWLPAFQRSEFQVAFSLFGATRPVFRLVSNIDDIAVNDTSGAIASFNDTTRVRVTWAPGDSVSRYAAWEHGIGEQSTSVHSDDFDDMAPDSWRTDGPPRLNLFPNTTSRILRFNRVEGLFTGIAPSVDFRNVAPGFTAGINVGWAWTEQTVRGGASMAYRRGQNTFGVRGERALPTTNDFTPPLSDDPGFGALLSSVDNYDYVDRRSAMLSLTHVLGSVDAGLATIQLGVADDRDERARLSYGLFHGAGPFRLNRGVASGRYAIGTGEVEIHPNVTGDFVTPGLGLRAHYESASGDLQWQRAELGLSARQYLGRVSFTAHADGGALLGSTPPPQQLFELGGIETLPGYEYKQFAGDRAALFRTFASYRFRKWERPTHLWRNYFLPGVSPGVAVSAQGGWTEISSAGAAHAVQELGGLGSSAPVSQATHGIRATVGGGLTLFSDILHIGVARPIDHTAPWKLVAGFGGTF